MENKYGLIIYKNTNNWGDDILSYASGRFLPRIDYIIDREALDTFMPAEKEKCVVKAIANGWYMYNRSNWPPSPYIKPLFIGIHFVDYKVEQGILGKYLDGLGREYLLEHAPIGCRDMCTLEALQKRDVPAYFSGCLTLALPPFEGVEPSHKVVCVDVNETVVNRARELFGADNVEVVTHTVSNDERGQEWQIREQYVETLLKKYQAAKLVITTRLHCALPCLALGTNVVMLVYRNADRESRIGTYYEYLHHYTEEDFLQLSAAELTALQNNPALEEQRQAMIRSCQEFVRQENDYSLETLPDVEEFKKFYVDKVLWQRSLLEDNYGITDLEKHEEIRAKLRATQVKIKENKAKYLAQQEKALVQKDKIIAQKEKENALAQKEAEQAKKSLKQKKAEIAKLQAELQNIRQGTSFKLGRLITWLPRKLLGKK